MSRHLERMLGKKTKKTGRPRASDIDERARLVCKIPQELRHKLERVVLLRKQEGERPQAAARPLDLGDVVAEALSTYLRIWEAQWEKKARGR